MVVGATFPPVPTEINPGESNGVIYGADPRVFEQGRDLFRPIAAFRVWFWALFALSVGVVAAIIDDIVGSSIVNWVTYLGFLLPGIAVTIRRLHDTSRSGWFYLLVLVPLGGFVVMYFAVQDGTPVDNAYGASPKGLTGPAPAFG